MTVKCLKYDSYMTAILAVMHMLCLSTGSKEIACELPFNGLVIISLNPRQKNITYYFLFNF